MTAMADQPASTSKSPPATRQGKGMSLDVFFVENELSRKRSEARKRAVKQWLRRHLKRSQRTQAADPD
jgi:hypothetical protein